MGRDIEPGDFVEVLDAGGKWLRRRALSGVVDGRDFPVIWVVEPDRYEHAATERVPMRWEPRVREYPAGLPWPEEDVRRPA